MCWAPPSWWDEICTTKRWHTHRLFSNIHADLILYLTVRTQDLPPSHCFTIEVLNHALELKVVMMQNDLSSGFALEIPTDSNISMCIIQQNRPIQQECLPDTAQLTEIDLSPFIQFKQLVSNPRKENKINITI